MDIAAAKTFLEIVKTGSFVSAASSLHVTQTAVSARMRVLEGELGEQLFNRTKAGVTLTPAGTRFTRFAVGFVQMWERARRTMALPHGRTSTISIGAELIVSNPLIQNWLKWMRGEHPDFAISAHIDNVEGLLGRVNAGALDLAILYGSPSHPTLVTELLVEEKLVLVQTATQEKVLGPEDYIAIDWGHDFSVAFQAAFPEMATPLIKVNYGPVALDYLLWAGGMAYLRMMIARPLLESGQVSLVPHAPQFSYSIYAIYSPSAEESVIRMLRQGLHACIGLANLKK